MLSIRAFPRCISHYLKQSQLHTSVWLQSSSNDPSSSSSSSSSDSSDSDSDKERKVEKKQKIAVKKEDDDFTSSEKTNDRLEALLLKISQASMKAKEKKEETDKSALETTTTKTKVISASAVSTPGIIDVAIKSRRIRFKKPETEESKKKEPLEKKIIGAAKEVAKSMEGDAEKTELELLSRILRTKTSQVVEDDKKEGAAAAGDEKQAPSLSELLAGMKADPPVTYEEQKQEMARKMKDRLRAGSVSGTLLYQKKSKSRSATAEIPSAPSGPELKAQCSPLNIFQNMPEEEPASIPQLLTWKEMEKREMKLATLTTPQNIFQELIQWTEQGKLWHFPINNEQGMESEESVHFSEHVFMERHLRSWCPKKGPIRYFMELVCTGLSKNPYMTVEEKVGHITWYKNYFEQRKELLGELGVLGTDKAPESAKQIEA